MDSKGFILTLDSVLAAVIILTLLSTADQGIVASERNIQSKLQMQRTGFDTINALINDGTLMGTEQQIRTKVNRILPPNYAMLVDVQRYTVSSGVATLQ
ncbi:MAG: hypothetical protein ABH950_09600, partial [Candidatus Altiarchaeota archaeon]